MLLPGSHSTGHAMWYHFTMRILPLLCAAALLPVPAKADKFWFSDPAGQTVEGTVPDLIQGVLISEDDNTYTIRVIGGEITLAKKRVFKVEKDGLTLVKLVADENVERQRLAQASERRALAKAADRLRNDVRAAEASATRGAAAPATRVARPVVIAEPAYDPLIGRTTNNAMMSRHQMMRELEFAWTMTKDRRYLKTLRKIRRMK